MIHRVKSKTFTDNDSQHDKLIFTDNDAQRDKLIVHC